MKKNQMLKRAAKVAAKEIESFEEAELIAIQKPLAIAATYGGRKAPYDKLKKNSARFFDDLVERHNELLKANDYLRSVNPLTQEFYEAASTARYTHDRYIDACNNFSLALSTEEPEKQ